VQLIWGNWTQTDTNGEYSLDILPGVALMEALPPTGKAYQPAAAIEVSGCEDQEVNFTLEPYEFTHQLNGQVFSADGTGRSRRVSASLFTAFSRTVSLTTTSDACGHFSLNVIPGQWNVGVESTSNEFGPSFSIVVSQQSNAQISFVTLPATHSVTGCVIDASNGFTYPPHIQVSTSRAGSNYTAGFFANYDGRFGVVLPEGTWTFKVGLWSAEGTYREARHVAPVTGPVTNLVLEIPPAPPLIPWSGSVVDEFGLSLSNVTVNAGDAIGTTDDFGAFGISVPPRLAFASVAVPPPLISPFIWILPDSDLLETSAQLVVHHPTTHVHAHVQTTEGQPLAGAVVNACLVQDGLSYFVGGRTDCNGNADFDAFPGKWMIAVQDGLQQTSRVYIAVSRLETLAAGETNITFTAPEENSRVMVNVEVRDDETGEEIPALFQITGARGQMEGFGTLSALLPAGPYWCYVFLQGHSMIVNLDLIEQISATNLVLWVHPRPINVLVEVPNAANASNLSVTAYHVSHGTNDEVSGKKITDTSFQLQLFSGDWWLSVRDYNLSESISYSISTNISLHVGATNMQVQIPARNATRNSILTGSVVDEWENPVPFASLYIISEQNIFDTFARSDGQFSIKVFPGECRILAKHHLFRFFVEKAVYLTNGENKNITLVLPQELVPVTCRLIDTESNHLAFDSQAVPANPDPTFTFSASAYLTESLESVLWLPVGQWSVAYSDWELNGRGWRSVTPTSLDLVQPTNVMAVTDHIVGDLRASRLRMEQRGTNVAVHITAQGGAEYALEASSDLFIWQRVATNYTSGGRATFILPTKPATTTCFFRAVYIER
jgi:hypothetical protein